MNRKLLCVAIVAASAVALGACSKGSHSMIPTATAPSASDALSPQAAQQAAVAAKAANLPQPNFSTPDSAYMTVTSGNQLMYLYAAFSGMPVNYDAIASAISQDYRGTSDAFKKHDMLAALKPQIDAAVADAKAHPYIVFTDNNPNVGHYDFQQKAFPVGDGLLQDGGSEYFYDNNSTNLAVTNGAIYQHFNVPDENLAKTIEGLVSNGANMKLRVFAFVQATDDSSGHVVKAMITKVQLVGSNGRVLLEQATPH